LLAQIEAGTLHPMEAKKQLAWEITDIFYGEEAAHEGSAHFERVHQERKLPENIPTLVLTEPKGLLDIMVDSELAPSKSQARRLVQQKGVRLDDVIVDDIGTVVAVRDQILQVGKRRFLHLLPG
ncbi:MAG: tyrosine--tRNA ligase, partial [Anaerolineae bacterium]|nr:tyrosine--tRNA ligase [Anaerolineae bacterium]